MARRSPINENRQCFVDHYCTDAAFNGALAYRMAYPLAKSGHKENAARLLTNDNVLEAIDKKKQEIAERVEITTELCTQRFNDVYEKAIADKDYAAALRAIENHAKNKGYYEADNAQKGVKLAIAIRNEQAAIDRQLAGLKALDDAPDALVL